MPHAETEVGPTPRAPPALLAVAFACRRDAADTGARRRESRRICPCRPFAQPVPQRPEERLSIVARPMPTEERLQRWPARLSVAQVASAIGGTVLLEAVEIEGVATVVAVALVEATRAATELRAPWHVPCSVRRLAPRLQLALQHVPARQITKEARVAVDDDRATLSQPIRDEQALVIELAILGEGLEDGRRLSRRRERRKAPLHEAQHRGPRASILAAAREQRVRRGKVLRREAAHGADRLVRAWHPEPARCLCRDHQPSVRCAQQAQLGLKLQRRARARNHVERVGVHDPLPSASLLRTQVVADHRQLARA